MSILLNVYSEYIHLCILQLLAVLKDIVLDTFNKIILDACG